MSALQKKEGWRSRRDLTSRMKSGSLWMSIAADVSWKNRPWMRLSHAHTRASLSGVRRQLLEVMRRLWKPMTGYPVNKSSLFLRPPPVANVKATCCFEALQIVSSLPIVSKEVSALLVLKIMCFSTIYKTGVICKSCTI